MRDTVVVRDVRVNQPSCLVFLCKQGNGSIVCDCTKYHPGVCERFARVTVIVAKGIPPRLLQHVLISNRYPASAPLPARPPAHAHEQMIELEPKNERNFYKRFRVFLSKRRYAEAILDLSRALELKPKYKQVIGRVDLAFTDSSSSCTGGGGGV